MRASQQTNVKSRRSQFKTLSLIPAFSPRRRRIVLRLLSFARLDLPYRSSQSQRRTHGCSFSPGEKVRMRASQQTIVKSRRSQFKTLSLIPAFSPRRRRVVLRLPELCTAGFAVPFFAKPETHNGCSFSPGEKVRMRASQQTIVKSRRSQFKTLSLIPAFSPRRRRIAFRLPELCTAGFAGPFFAKPETHHGCSFSPGEKVRMRASQQTIRDSLISTSVAAVSAASNHEHPCRRNPVGHDAHPAPNPVHHRQRGLRALQLLWHAQHPDGVSGHVVAAAF